ncbi:MAG TPA: hypothetical protein DCM08_09595, partial [Microscillaceae bacterium]|nr:hypothetical protein [Microscillaceae bacterium]
MNPNFHIPWQENQLAQSKSYLIFGCLFCCLCGAALAQKPKIENGVLDLRQWNFERDGAINLDGRWEFYYEAFLSDSALQNIAPANRNYLEVPAASWDIQPYRGKKIDGFGYATYRLRVWLPANCPPLALKTIDQSTAYQLFIDKQLIARIGTLGKTKETHIGSAQTGIFTFQPTAKEISIRVHISNFSHRKGGLWHSFQLGTIA